MSINDEKDQLIDDFIHLRLTKSAHEAFEREMRNDSELAEIVLINQNLIQILGENNIQLDRSNAFPKSSIIEAKKVLASDYVSNMRNVLSEANTSYQSKSEKKSIPLFRYLSIAASIAIILVAFSLFPSDRDSSELYADYKNELLPVSFVERSENSEIAEKVEALFKNKKHQQVLNLINENQDMIAEYPNILIFQGLSYRELNQNQLALDAFNKFEEISPLDAYTAYWHKGLVFLKLDKNAEAKEAFSKLVENANYPGYQEAKEILKNLK